MKQDLVLRAAICEVGRRLWQRGLVSGNEGNISVRISPDTVLCTPAGAGKGQMKPDEIVKIDLSGKPLDGGRPSSEIKIHLEAYRKRPDCAAVVHAHPPTALAFTLAGVEIPDNVLPESAVILGSVPTVPFKMPGTQDLADEISPYLEDHKTLLLSHHGAMVLGKDVYDAWARMECLESVCKVLMSARLLGDTRPMPASAFNQFLETALNGRLD